jgi:hypothetical protein
MILNLEKTKDAVLKTCRKENKIPTSYILFKAENDKAGIVDINPSKPITALNLASFDLHVAFKGIMEYIAVFEVIMKNKEKKKAVPCLKFVKYRRNGLHSYIMIPYRIANDKLDFGDEVWSDILVAENDDLSYEDLFFEPLYNMYEQKGLSEFDDMNICQKVDNYLVNRQNYKKVRDSIKQARGDKAKVSMKDCEEYLYKNEIYNLVKRKYNTYESMIKEDQNNV